VPADLAQVLREPDGAHRALAADDRAGDRDRDALRRLRDEGRVEVADASGPALAGLHRIHHLACLREVWIQARHVLAEHVAGRVAERLTRAVVVEGDDAVPIDGDDDVGGILEQLLEVDGRKTKRSHGMRSSCTW
jgi:hypothetical protein